ncbi:MAG: hypothetical protein E7B37_05490, partial [Bradyrhizobium sp.]|nr:hypothetical protein [Bradyrhizobium sp.]
SFRSPVFTTIVPGEKSPAMSTSSGRADAGAVVARPAPRAAAANTTAFAVAVLIAANRIVILSSVGLVPVRAGPHRAIRGKKNFSPK